MNTIFFDLDGTLLPMNQEVFLETYFGLMGKMTASRGVDPKPLIQAIWTGTEAMIRNDGTMTNEVRFWQVFDETYGDGAERIRPLLEDFYATEFDKAKAVIHKNPLAKECVELLKDKGYTLALTTNPLFPEVATRFRIAWAGLDPADFAWVTTYENSRFSKPNLAYYQDVLDKLGKSAGECLMVGNDAKEDLCVTELGMDTFLLTDHLIHKGQEDLSHHRQGDFVAFYNWIQTLPSI
jgi:FMN phosphatase YigB (HAD superfamily)